MRQPESGEYPRQLQWYRSDPLKRLKETAKLRYQDQIHEYNRYQKTSKHPAKASHHLSHIPLRAIP